MNAQRVTGLSIALVLAVSAVPLGLGIGIGRAASTLDFTVAGDGAAASILDAGGRVIDDYGPFASAALTEQQALALVESGFTLATLSHETGRGAFRFDGRAGDALVPEPLRSDGSDVAIVQFRGPIRAEWRAALDEVATVFDYLPYNSFLVRMSPADQAAFAERNEVSFVGAYHAGYKLSTDLPTEGVADVRVLAFKDADFATVLAGLATLGHPARQFATSNPLDNSALVTLPVALLDDVARFAAVSWIEPSLETQDVLDNAESVAITMTGTTTSTRVGDLGVDGSSQVTSVCDTGVNTSGGTTFTMVHEMFADGANALTLNTANPTHRKVLMYYAPVENNVRRGDGDDTSGHGTHTAGTLAGNAGAAGRGGNDGFGLASKLMVCDITIGGSFQLLSDYSNYWKPAYDNGARVNSNSWGQSHTNTYNALARMHDAYVWDHRDFNILRSMGNTGPSGSIRPEAVAKNAFGIGATVNGAGMESMASFSTRGPTADNRLKPEVVAPGDCLDSSYLSGATSYACLSGTSMSTPSVAGAATLVRDYLAKGYYPGGSAGSGPAMNPSHALVRAMLINSGKEMTGTGSHPAPYNPWIPDAVPAGVKSQLNTALGAAGQGASFPNGGQGWGRVTLDDVMYFAGDARKLFLVDEGAGLATGGTATFTVTVTDATLPLEITLAWADFAAAAGANPAIVNDLDLTVVGPSLAPLNGNVILNGESAPLPAKDKINVSEGVIVKAPTPGVYTITVTGANVANGPQPFAIAATGGF